MAWYRRNSIVQIPKNFQGQIWGRLILRRGMIKEVKFIKLNILSIKSITQYNKNQIQPWTTPILVNIIFIYCD